MNTRIRVQIELDRGGGRLDVVTLARWLDIPHGMSETRAALHALQLAIDQLSGCNIDAHDPARRHD